MEQDIHALAGADARDCGLISLGTEQSDNAETRRCARQAAAEPGPFVFGYVGLKDAMFCDVAVRDTSGQLFNLFYLYEFPGQSGEDAAQSSVQAMRCGSLRFRPGTVAGNSYFDMDDCQDASDVADAIIAASNARVEQAKPLRLRNERDRAPGAKPTPQTSEP